MVSDESGSCSGSEASSYALSDAGSESSGWPSAMGDDTDADFSDMGYAALHRTC